MAFHNISAKDMKELSRQKLSAAQAPAAQALKKDTPKSKKPKNHKPAKAGRVGIIDIGSNSVRLVIFEGTLRAPLQILNEKVLCGLGKSVADSGYLRENSRERALAAIKRFVILCRKMSVSLIDAVATAALREAQDGSEFAAEIEAQTGLKVRIITGTEEAALSARAVLLALPNARGIVCDLGGASMELAHVEKYKIGTCLSTGLAPLPLLDIYSSAAARAGFIRAEIDKLYAQMGQSKGRLYLVGGSWRAIARIDMVRRDYPLRVMHEYRLNMDDIRKTYEWLQSQSPETLSAIPNISVERMRLVPCAMEILQALTDRFRPDEVLISAYGIREGVFAAHMPQKLHKRDLLIEVSRYAEACNARLPGFGAKLYRFIKPVLSQCSREHRRITKAACLLHDLNWRAHPDYRTELCFENATRANLVGLDHRERVFLSLALSHRYKTPCSKKITSLLGLLTEKDKKAALLIGRAMRFGAIFPVKNINRLAHLEWETASNRLVLSLKGEGIVLHNQSAQERFSALAAIVMARPVVRKI